MMEPKCEHFFTVYGEASLLNTQRWAWWVKDTGMWAPGGSWGIILFKVLWQFWASFPYDFPKETATAQGGSLLLVLIKANSRNTVGAGRWRWGANREWCLEGPRLSLLINSGKNVTAWFFSVGLFLGHFGFTDMLLACCYWQGTWLSITQAAVQLVGQLNGLIKTDFWGQSRPF